MRCFGGCFSPVDVEKPAPASAAYGGAQLPEGPIFTSSKSLPAEDLQRVCNGFYGTQATGVVRADLKASIRLVARKGNDVQGADQPVSSSRSTTSSSSSRFAFPDGSKGHLWQQYLLQHGRNIMSVSTLQQEGLQHFIVPGVGYIAYAMMYNGPEFLRVLTAVGLADPVCDPKHYRSMAEAFLTAHPKAMFAQVSAEFAAVLQDLGFTVNSMGGETRLDMATYNFTGYARRGLRSAITSATKEGLVVQEVMPPPAGTLGANAPAAAKGLPVAEDWSALAAEMQEVDAKWAATKAGRASEVWFINRRPVYAPEPGVRKFIVRNPAGQLQGYIFFDGVYENGQLVGYYANVTRMLPDAHPGTLNLLIKTFIERMRSEAQVAAPAKKLSMRRSARKKQEAAAAAAAAAASDSAAAKDQGTAAPASGTDPSAASPGPKFLSLGLSPFYQMDNTGWNSCKKTDKLLRLCYDDLEGFYPFKTLAAAKAKYGAGLHDGKYEDPAVEYRQAYLCHRRGGSATVAVFDLAKFFGLWKHPGDFFGRFLAQKVKARRQKGKAHTGVSSCSSASASATTSSSASKNPFARGFSSSSFKKLLSGKQGVPPAGDAQVVAAAAATAPAATAVAAAAVTPDHSSDLIGTADNICNASEASSQTASQFGDISLYSMSSSVTSPARIAKSS